MHPPIPFLQNVELISGLYAISSYLFSFHFFSCFFFSFRFFFETRNAVERNMRPPKPIATSVSRRGLGICWDKESLEKSKSIIDVE